MDKSGLRYTFLWIETGKARFLAGAFDYSMLNQDISLEGIVRQIYLYDSAWFLGGLGLTRCSRLPPRHLEYEAGGMSND
jgi:hypothetical protein